MSTIIAEDMSLNSDTTMTSKNGSCLVACLGTISSEDMSECVDLFVDAIKDRTALVNFISNITADHQLWVAPEFWAST